jgi:mediator of RNA polymerase II transcription subunit 17, fungi type
MSRTVASFTVPVDVSYQDRKHAPSQDLQDRVLQIIQQKGHFRHVTEESLLAQEDDEEDEESNAGEAVEDASPQTAEEKLMKGRVDMMRELERAQQDNLVALETISFLLAKHTASGKASMGDELKKRAPPGSLESKVVQPRHLLDTKARDIALNSQAWRSKGFDAAFQTLSAATNRLKEETERESKYWTEVSKLREAETTISRYPRESAVAVHFGASNSSLRSRQQGIGLLRQDASSEIYLERRPSPRQQHRLQVQIYRGTNCTAAYTLTPDLSSENTNISRAIETAQINLLEDEMFYEMGREAREAANQGVMTREQSISFEVDDEYIVSIVFDKPAAHETTHQDKDHDLAEYIDLSLRALLKNAHHQLYAQRARAPVRLTAQPRHSEEQMILRPLIAHLRHRARVDDLTSWVSSQLLAPVRNAGLDIDWQISPSIEALTEQSELPDFSSVKPSRTDFSFVLPSHHSARVHVVSSLLSPVYGTQYEISAVHYESSTISAATYQNVTDCHDALAHLLKMGLTFLAASISKSATDKKDSDPGHAEWQVSRPHGGELSFTPKQSRKSSAGMQIDVQSGVITLRVSPFNAEYLKGREGILWSWAGLVRPSLSGRPEDIGIDKVKAERLSFSEVVTQSTQSIV